MVVIGRLLIAVVILGAIVVHGLVPVVKVTEFTNPRIYELLSGADPLITAYVDAGWLPAILLAISTLCLLGAFIGVLQGERWAAGLIVLAAFADAASLRFAETMGYTGLGLSWLQIGGLGGVMIVLFLLVRAVTKPA